MSIISDLLKNVKHRPWNLPPGNWLYYQEWNDVLFLHYEVDFKILRKLVPARLNLDQINGKYYVSIVAFRMENIRPRYLPSIGFISNFHEINVRTYIDYQNKKGVYFINIEAEKLLSAIIAKQLSGLPYEKSDFDLWLTERYCLYVDVKDDLFRYNIHHEEWCLKNIDYQNLEIDYHFGNLRFNKNNINSSHYSQGVKVLSWASEKL